MRISWAMPAAISPTAARRCCTRASRASLRDSVTSWNVKRKPISPRGVISRAVLNPSSRCVESSRVNPNSTRGSGGRPSRGTNSCSKSGGSWSTSAAAAPTAAEAGTPEISSAARLNVRIRPWMSVVASPLVRLSMMCWLNAWRSAIWFDASASFSSARRSPSAR